VVRVVVAIPLRQHDTMSSLKRKDAPGGDPSSNHAKKSKGVQGTKQNGTGKDRKTSDKSTTSKKNTQATDAPAKAKAAVVSVLKNEEPMFPRGGGSVLTPLEQKQIQLEAKADAMREEEFNTGGKPLKKKKRKAALQAGKKTEGGVPQEEHVKVESLSFKVRMPMGG
jgi:rRNA biogenesis protein RRP5